MLDLVQQALEREKFSVVRIDGQKSLKDRTAALSRFKVNPRCTVMLASIGSAGEGCVPCVILRLMMTADTSPHQSRFHDRNNRPSTRATLEPDGRRASGEPCPSDWTDSACYHNSLRHSCLY